MAVSPVVDEGRKVLATRTVDGDRQLSAAIYDAFEAAGVDVSDRQTVLYDWIDCDALADLRRNSRRPLQVSVVVWNHRVLVTEESVTVYAAEC